MQETPPILLIRRNIKYNRLIQSAILICSMMLLITSTMLVSNKDENVIKKVTEKVTQKVDVSTEKVELSAGVSKAIFKSLKKPKVKLETEIELGLEKLNLDTVTAAETETQILYKSIEEIEISRDMDLTQTTGISREDFCQLLAEFKYDYDGFYEKNAGLIWDLSQTYQVNEIFICGVFALESYYGSNEKHIAAHNYGSMMNRKGKLIQYESDEEGIEANFKLFANSYLNPEGKYYKGVTLDSIGDTYCPPTTKCPSWAGKVYKCMQMFIEQE